METLDYDYTVHQRPNADDEKLYVQFFMDAVEDHDASKVEGRPIFKDAEMIRIIIPGSKDNIVVRPIRERDRQRFAQRYAMWKQRTGDGEVITGTPLEQWPLLSRAQCEEFKHFNIRTVEQLAGVPDSTAQKFMGFDQIKRKAADFVSSAKAAAPLAALRDELDAARVQIEAQGQEIARLLDLAGSKKGK